jgi:hypothetical protein
MKGSSLKSFVLGAALVATGLWAAAVTIPNSFSAGEVLSAAKLNANFAAIKTAVDALEAAITSKQNRVTGTCTVGQTIQAINEDGSVTCGTSTRGSAWISAAGTGHRSILYSNQPEYTQQLQTHCGYNQRPRQYPWSD